MNQAEAGALLEGVYQLDTTRWLEHLGWKVFDWQKAVLRDRATRICINGARQAGKSTIISSKACHMAKYRKGSLTVILAPTQKQSQEDMEKINSFLSRDPAYPERIKNNSEELKLENGSRILVLTASDDAARGFSNPDLIIFDEASRIDDSVYDAVRPMITNNLDAVIVEISTPNGKKGFFYNHFHSQSWSRYEVRCPWDYVATSSLPTLRKTTYHGIDGVSYFLSPRHFNLTEQMEVIRGGQGGYGMSERKYRQEYCCEFVEAEAQVFANELIDSLYSDDAIKPFEETDVELLNMGGGEPNALSFPSFEQWERKAL